MRIDRPNVPVVIAKEDTTLVIQNPEPPRETRAAPPLPNLLQRKDDLYASHGFKQAPKPKVDRSPVAYGFLRITTVVGDDVVRAALSRKRKGLPERYDYVGMTPWDLPVVPGPVDPLIAYDGDPPFPHRVLVLDRKEWRKEKGGMHEVIPLRGSVFVEEDAAVGGGGDRGDRPSGKPMTRMRPGSPR